MGCLNAQTVFNSSSDQQQEVKPKKRKEILQIIIDWASVTTAHGPGNIARASNYFLKSIWLICMLGSIAFCTYQVIMTIIQFTQNETVTSSKIYHEAPTKFPAVAFCNLNPYNGNYARTEMEQILSDEKIASKGYEPIDYVDKASEYFKTEFETRDAAEKYDYGFYLSEMLLTCRFLGQPCYQSDFESFRDYNYGNCYRFNKPSNLSLIKETKKPGWKNGLRLELYIGDLDTAQQYTYKAGMKIIIYNQSATPFPDEDGIDVSVGTQTNIKISRTFISRLPSPYSDCVSNFTSEENLKQNELFQYIKNYFSMSEYSQKFCLKICLQKFIISNCSCFDYELPNPLSNSSFKACTSVEEIDCTNKAETYFYGTNETQTCESKCPIECNQLVYDLKTSTAKYPSKWYSLIMNNYTRSSLINLNGLSYTDLQQLILMVNINYEDMFYTNVTQSPAMTIEQLISFIGGNFGLFVGISLLSLIEGVEVIFYLIYLFIKRRSCLKSKKSDKSKSIIVGEAKKLDLVDQNNKDMS